MITKHFSILLYTMPNIIENIKSLADVMNTMDQLNDPQFIEEQWLSEEDVTNISQELIAQLEVYKSEANDYVAYQLSKRQDALIMLNGRDIEIKRLTELMNWDKKKVERIEKWIDYILQTFKIEKMETELNKLSYRKSESVEFVDEALIPEKFKVIKETTNISKTEIKNALKLWESVPGVIIKITQNLQIK